MTPATHEALEARIEVELALRKAAYERIATLERELRRRGDTVSAGVWSLLTLGVGLILGYVIGRR